ncbi:hypothetical protein D3C81_1076260 [compost metagenome]
MVGIVRVQLTFEREHHVVGVKIAGRFEVFVALPLHAFTQVESVGFAVFADVPFFGQARLQFGGADFEFDQTVIDGHRAGIIGGTRGEQLRVEPFRGPFRTVNQRFGLYAGRYGQRNQPNPEFQNPCFSQGTCHRCAPLCDVMCVLLPGPIFFIARPVQSAPEGRRDNRT